MAKKKAKRKVSKRVSEISWDDFPYRKNEEGKPLCRKCGVVLTGRKTAWCSRACVNEVRAMIDWTFIRRRVLKKAKYRCALCGQKATQVDHIVEIADGGSFWEPSNLRAICAPEHLMKTLEMRKIRAARKKLEKQ